MLDKNYQKISDSNNYTEYRGRLGVESNVDRFSNS